MLRLSVVGNSKFCVSSGVENSTTTHYYPQAYLAERVNRNFKAALEIPHHESLNTWNNNLP